MSTNEVNYLPMYTRPYQSHLTTSLTLHSLSPAPRPSPTLALSGSALPSQPVHSSSHPVPPPTPLPLSYSTYTPPPRYHPSHLPSTATTTSNATKSTTTYKLVPPDPPSIYLSCILLHPLHSFLFQARDYPPLGRPSLHPELPSIPSLRLPPLFATPCLPRPSYALSLPRPTG